MVNCSITGSLADHGGGGIYNRGRLTGQAARSITLDQITRIMQNRDLVQVIHQNTFNIPISAKEKRK